ncbi:MAG: tail fiber domain-containing protein, partial [Desulfobacterales bacterium]|nr:tail fiber domain-containing protein [Desulfobacterales bacterium]
KEQDQKQLGFIAQEVEEIYPFFVSGTDTKSLNYNNFIGILVKEMKDLKKRVTELETKKDI